MGLFYVVLFFAFMALIAYIYQAVRIKKYRQRGIYPLKGKVTEEDIKRLALSGERILAIRAYRELNKCSLKKAVEEMRKM